MLIPMVVEQSHRGERSYSMYRPVGNCGIEDSFRNPRRPPTPRDITGIGMLSFFAQWLIDMRSYTVALLWGMIGFGLIGSVVSRALSPSPTRAPHSHTAAKNSAVFVVMMSR